MFSVRDLKDSINERLGAAVVEILKVFKRTIRKYEDHHCRLLDHSWTRTIQTHNAEFPQHCVCKEEALFEQQLYNQDEKPDLSQEELERRQVKLEQEELCASQDGDKLSIKVESDIHFETPPSGHSDEQLYYNCVKELIGERLTAAVEEVSAVFKKSMSRFKEDRRLMGIFWQPRVSLCRAELSQQHVCKEETEKVLFEPQLNNQEELQVEMEQEELCTTQIAEKLVFKLKSEIVLETPPAGQSDERLYYTCVKELVCQRLSAAVKEISTVFEKSISQFEEERRLMEIFCQPRVRLCRLELSRRHVCKEEKEEECLSMKQELPTFMANQTYEESNSESLFSHSSSLNESQEQTGREGVASGSTNAEMKAMATGLETQCGTVTEKYGFKCGVCEKIFQSKAALKGHRKIHTDRNPEKCDICAKTYASKGHLKRHLRFHTDEKTFSCEMCGKAFTQQGNLSVHVRSHTGEKPYSCETCGKAFTQQGNLSVHVRTHTGEKPFSCDACGKRFIYATHLKSHMRIHNNVKPFPCEECGESFRHKITLSRHMEIHTGKRKHTCETCNKGFRDSNSLSMHIRRHTGEKPYPCHTCGHRFALLTDLRRHLERAHVPKSSYSCVTCARSFSEKNSLLYHMKKHTGE